MPEVDNILIYIKKKKTVVHFGANIGVLKDNKFQCLKKIGSILTRPITLMFSRNTLFYKVSI
jgi:hypothetical protein